MESQFTYMVCTRCTTFNHYAYIEDTMNGFCMQKTDFPFVCIITDDASTDGEQEVIKKYFEANFSLLETEETNDYVLNFGQHIINGNCYFAVLYLRYNHFSIKKDKAPYFTCWENKSKYLALCEGDDYWTDENKLKKQVDFLENHKEYSMVFHGADILSENNMRTPFKCFEIEDREYSPDEVFKNWIVPTASILANRAVLDVKNDYTYKPMNGDIILILNCAKIGKIGGMSGRMSVYRVHPTGVTYDKRLKREWALRHPEHIKFIRSNYSFLSKKIVRQELSLAYIDMVRYANKIFTMFEYFFKAELCFPGIVTSRIIKKIAAFWKNK